MIIKGYIVPHCVLLGAVAWRKRRYENYCFVIRT